MSVAVGPMSEIRTYTHPTLVKTVKLVTVTTAGIDSVKN